MQEDKTYWIIDATKISDYQQCPRSYLFRYLFGWQPSTPSIHLQFGIAWHLAMEHLLANGYDQDSVDTAIDVFTEAFHDGYVMYQGDDHPTKNTASAMYALQAYAQTYHDDLQRFEVIATEIAGKVNLTDTKALYFRMDTMCKGSVKDCPPGYFSLEHKTGTRNDRVWKDQWLQKTQIGGYNYVLHCVYPAEEVRGVCINGVFPRMPPELKRDGSPRAGARDVEFTRLLYPKTSLQLEDWYQNTIDWYDSIIRDTELALATPEDAPILTAFRKNPEHCTSYFGCPFMDYCHAWPNPIGRADVPQQGFVKCFWNPQAMLERAKKVIEV